MDLRSDFERACGIVGVKPELLGARNRCGNLMRGRTARGERVGEISELRGVVSWLMRTQRENHPPSYKRIAEIVTSTPQISHCAVYHGIRAVEKRRGEDQDFRVVTDGMMEMMKSTRAHGAQRSEG